jgi:hypothetical protein
VHDGDIWLNDVSHQMAIAHNGVWISTATVQPFQVGGTVWTAQQDLPFGAVWWRDHDGRYWPDIYNGREWLPAYPPAVLPYTPPELVHVLQEGYAAYDGSNVGTIAVKSGTVGVVQVDLNAATTRRPKLIFYSDKGGSPVVMPDVSRVNDIFLGSGVGTSEEFHASSVRFGHSLPHLEGTQLRVENANILRCSDDDDSNQLQLSYTLRYSVITNVQAHTIIRFELQGSVGKTVDAAVPVTVHANMEFDERVTGFKIINTGFVSQMTHTYLGGHP